MAKPDHKFFVWGIESGIVKENLSFRLDLVSYRHLLWTFQFLSFSCTTIKVNDEVKLLQGSRRPLKEGRVLYKGGGCNNWFQCFTSKGRK